MRNRSVPFWISALVHLGVFGAAGFLFINPPEFAMDAGHNSVEVSLVAAAPDPEPETPPPPVPDMPEPALPDPPKPDDVVVPVAPPTPPQITPPPQEKPEPPPPVVKPAKPHRVPTVAKGDGSSPKPGKDAITATSDGGAVLDTKPDYLSNPPPIYPESARNAKQEGIVMLEVIVDTEGHPEEVTVLTSSGVIALDRSALAAVHRWRFRPATMGSFKVKSRVRFPVHFQLDR